MTGLGNRQENDNGIELVSRSAVSTSRSWNLAHVVNQQVKLSDKISSQDAVAQRHDPHVTY
jgi:hypothetical protein